MVAPDVSVPAAAFVLVGVTALGHGIAVAGRPIGEGLLAIGRGLSDAAAEIKGFKREWQRRGRDA
jgi:hypothetical protein